MSDKYKSQYLTRVRFVNLCDKFKYSPLCIPYAFEIVAGSRSISDGFSILNFRGKPILSINDEHSKLVINHVSELLKELYEVKQGNRHKIVANVVQMLGENSEKYVFRYDIKKFYESIHPEYIYRMVISDPAISPNSKALVRMYLKGIEDKGIFGVGRGTSLSAALAEYYLLDFDKVIRRIDGVYYYARFVDDIIVFSYKKVDKQNLATHYKSRYLGSSTRLSKSVYVEELLCRGLEELRLVLKTRPSIIVVVALFGVHFYAAMIVTRVETMTIAALG